MKIEEVNSEISGSVWKIMVNVGDEVMEDDILIILESMKMEIPLMSTSDGIIKEIKVEEGDTVGDGTVVITIEK